MRTEPSGYGKPLGTKPLNTPLTRKNGLRKNTRNTQKKWPCLDGKYTRLNSQIKILQLFCIYLQIYLLHL